MSTYLTLLTLLTALRRGSEQAEGVQGLGGEHAKDAEAGNGDAQDHAHGGKEDAAHPHGHEGVQGEVQEVAGEGGQIPPGDVREVMPGEHEGRGDGGEEGREGIREAVAHAGDDGLLGTRGGAEEHRGVHAEKMMGNGGMSRSFPVKGAARVIRSVTVKETGEARPVFYVRRPLLWDDLGRVCPTPLELGVNLARALERRDKEAVAGFCWSALNFVHNGEVPEDWLGVWNEYGPIPLAI